MQLRKLLLATGATVAAGALALAPAAQATTPGGPINYVSVGGNSTNGTNAATLTIKTPASVTMDVYGSPMTLNCYSGGATATVNRGTTGLNPNPAISFNTLSLNCDTWSYPNTTATMSLPSNGCANFVATDTTVHDGTVDTGPKGGKFSPVEGLFNAIGSTCQVTVTVGSTCTVKINGSTGMQFDEGIKSTSPVTQELIVKGNGLTITSRTIGCLGAIGVGDAITINDIKFNVTTNGGAGAIDFRQTP